MLDALLFDGMREMGLDPNRQGTAKLLPYLNRLLERNQSLNLTAVKAPEVNCTPKVGQESQRKGCRNLWEKNCSVRN